MATASDLPAGRELDFAVHEIMTGERRPYAEHRAGSVPTDWELSCPRYSTDIAAAWTVVLRLFDLEAWDAILLSATSCDPYFDRDQLDHADGDTAAHAICRAALKAISGSTPGTP